MFRVFYSLYTDIYIYIYIGPGTYTEKQPFERVLQGRFNVDQRDPNVPKGRKNVPGPGAYNTIDTRYASPKSV